MEGGAVARGRFGAADGIGNAAGQAVATADHGQTDAVAHQRFDLAGEIDPQQRHQTHDLRPGSPPIVAGERIERQRADALIRGGLDDTADRLDAGFVSAQPGQPLACRPPAIAVHDDANVKAVHHSRRFELQPTLHCKAPGQKKRK